jgi:hypothetical protein
MTMVKVSSGEGKVKQEGKRTSEAQVSRNVKHL